MVVFAALTPSYPEGTSVSCRSHPVSDLYGCCSLVTLWKHISEPSIYSHKLSFRLEKTSKVLKYLNFCPIIPKCRLDLLRFVYIYFCLFWFCFKRVTSFFKPWTFSFRTSFEKYLKTPLTVSCLCGFFPKYLILHEFHCAGGELPALCLKIVWNVSFSKSSP